MATLHSGDSGGFIASTAAPMVTGRSDLAPGRVCLPLWSNAFSLAHCKRGCYRQPHHSFGLDDAGWFASGDGDSLLLEKNISMS
jgi:hypothetical protein